MAVKVHIIFHSMYGHVWKLAEGIAEGARQAGGEVELYQVQETLPADVLEKMHATQAKKAFAHIPVADPKKLADADVIFLGSGTRYGGVTSQLQAFLDQTGGLWGSGALIGKVGSAFASTASQHGGQETTIVRLHTFFYHMGMVVTGVPYSAPELLNLNEITGGTPYGATAIAGPKGERDVTANELAIARFQGKFATEIATKLKK